MELLKVKSVSSGRSLAACCPFCVDAGKEPDTKYHLYINKGKYIYCYRCGFKRPYHWFAQHYEMDTASIREVFVERPKSDFNSFVVGNTTGDFSSFSRSAALNYLKKRGIDNSLINYFNIRLFLLNKPKSGKYLVEKFFS